MGVDALECCGGGVEVEVDAGLRAAQCHAAVRLSQDFFNLLSRTPLTCRYTSNNCWTIGEEYFHFSTFSEPLNYLL